jgi:hypothetical protein
MRAACVFAVLAVAGSLACSGSKTSPAAAPPSKLKVVDVEVGRAVGADKRVTTPTGAFAPGDVLYASVETKGAVPRAVLAARWSYNGALLAETEQKIAPDGTAVSEFHVSNPSGWTPGAYRVEILIDGRVVADRAFRVDANS